MVRSSVGAVVLPCVLFYLLPPRFSRPAHRLATGRKISWRSPVGAPVTRSSDLPHRLWQLTFRELTILTPMVQFPVAPRRFQRRQGQYPLRRPTHPLVLATPRDRPV